MNGNLNCPVFNKGTLAVGANGYLCDHFNTMDDKCSFRIFKTYFGKEMTNNIVQQLCENKTTVFFDDLLNKEGNAFRARLIIVDGVIKPQFENEEIENYEELTKLVSPCPKCGKGVAMSNTAFGCVDYYNHKVCDFHVLRKIKGVKLSVNDVEVLLNGSSTDYKTDFLSKSNKHFGAKLILDDEYHIKFDFEFLKCPKCKTGSVSSNHWAYGCSNYRNENIKCGFTIWREVLGTKISLIDLQDLCDKHLTAEKMFSPKDGDQFTARFKFNDDYKLEIKRNP